MKLIGNDIVIEFIETVLYTGRIVDANPVSALLIALPECGKTSSVSSLFLDAKCKTAIQLTDATGRGLMELCKYRPEVSHFVLNDFVAIMSHRESVNKYTLAVLSAMTEEGISTVAWPGQVDTFMHGKRAIIGCSTPGVVNDGRQWWVRHGLASRMLPFYYDHSANLSIQIKDSIDSEREEKSKGIVLHVPDKLVRIPLSETQRQRIRILADNRAKILGDPKGYRRLKQYRTLVKAHALARAKRKSGIAVNEQDLAFLEVIDRFVSYTEPVKL